MIIVSFSFQNKIIESVLAHTKKEAETLLRILKKEEPYQNCNFEKIHSFVVAKPTAYSIFSKDEKGNILVLNWKDEQKGKSGRVGLWTELPVTIKNNNKKEG